MSDAFQKYQQAGLQKQEKTEPEPTPVPEGHEFYEELKSLINRHSKENGSGTPDHILAEYLIGCLDIFDNVVKRRAEWRGERLDSIFDVTYEKPVPVTIFDGNGGPGNQIGTAKVTVWPGETMAYGRVVKLMPVFEERTPVDTSDIGEDDRVD